MKKKIIPILCIAILCACNKNNTVDILDVQAGDAGVPIDFTIQNEAATKASVVSSLERINITCSTGTAGVSETEKWTVPQVNIRNNKVVTGKYWPSTDENYIFYASNLTLTPSSTGPEINISNSTDCVVARNVSPNYKAANTLTFNHILARVNGCTVSGPDGFDLSNVILEFTPATGGKFNCGTQKYTVTSSGTPVNLLLAASSQNVMDIWTLPGDFELHASYKLTKGDWSKTYNTDKTLTLQPGKRHKINVLFSAPQADEVTTVDFNIEIIDWKDQTTVITF